MRRITRHPAGFTLPEVLMASVILAFAVAAICYAISTGHAQTYNALHELRAMSLAEALMEEIVSKPYADPQGASASPGPDAGESQRAHFDNCDDYHGYSEGLGEVIDAAGLVYPRDFARFGRSASAAYESIEVSAMGDAIQGLTVTVTVTDDHGRTWQALRFIPEPLE